MICKNFTGKFSAVGRGTLGKEKIKKLAVKMEIFSREAGAIFAAGTGKNSRRPARRANQIGVFWARESTFFCRIFAARRRVRGLLARRLVIATPCKCKALVAE
jgi:hypothetical protein